MRLSLTSKHPDCMMKTSSSRTDCDILTLISPLEKRLTSAGTRGWFNLAPGEDNVVHEFFCILWYHTSSSDADCSAMALASSMWLLPVDGDGSFQHSII